MLVAGVPRKMPSGADSRAERISSSCFLLSRALFAFSPIPCGLIGEMAWPLTSVPFVADAGACDCALVFLDVFFRETLVVQVSVKTR